jgi:fibronectin type 3 domain-containing protein
MARFILFFSIVVCGLLFIGCGSDAGKVAESIPGLQNPGIVPNVNATPSYRKVRVTWTKLSETDITGYHIYRSQGSGGYNLIGSTGQVSPPYFQDEGDDDGSGIPTGLTNNVTHFYKVTAFNREGRETPIDSSTSVSAIPGQADSVSIDLNVSLVKAYTGKNEAYLTWEKINDSRVIGYNIYRTISGTSQGPVLLSFTPPDINSFIDGGLSNKENYIYQVSPAINTMQSGINDSRLSGYIEGRRTESRAVRPDDTGTKTPKPPGSSPTAAFSITAEVQSRGGQAGVLLRFTRPSSNTDGTLLSNANDNLTNGAYLIYRSGELYGRYNLMGMIENAGNNSINEYFDPSGGSHDFYYVTAGDAFGNISAPSDYASAEAVVPPITTKALSATAGGRIGSIFLTWKELPGENVNHYNVYRSTNPNKGFNAIAHHINDENPHPDYFSFTDNGDNMVFGQTYYYKISSTRDGLESALSAATASAPGPSEGVIFLEGENAVVREQGLYTAQFDENHWEWQKRGYHYPFSGNGVLHIRPQYQAYSNHVNGERLDLFWKVEVPTVVSNLSPLTGASANLYLITADDSTTGQYKVFIDDKEIDRTVPPDYPTSTFTGISAEINFNSRVYTDPIQPTRRLIGRLDFENLVNNDTTTGLLDAETIYMTIIHTGPADTSNGYGDLKIDALLLVFTATSQNQ